MLAASVCGLRSCGFRRDAGAVSRLSAAALASPLRLEPRLPPDFRYLYARKKDAMLSLPCAKINIGLNVTGTRPDGYHDIETVLYPIPLTDVLEIWERGDGAEDLQITGMPEGADPRRNLVCAVCSDLRSEFRLPPLSIRLYKRIPVGAGLGGGSSDAAEALKAVNEMFSLGMDEDEMERRVSRYGADCAFFIRRKPVFAEGVGNVFSEISVSLSRKFIVLVKPAASVNTREAYSWMQAGRTSRRLRECVESGIGNWRASVGNDFEAAVFRARPEIRAIKETLYDMGAEYASMSGSGSAVYGIFGRPAEEAAEVFADCFVFRKQLR